MTQYPRYAIYFVPDPEDALYRFGAEMLGYDAFSGATLPFPNDMLQSVPDWEQLTEDPRKYGFHVASKKKEPDTEPFDVTISSRHPAAPGPQN